jgi:hypothetical protein
LNDLGENPIGPVGDIYWMPVNMQNAKVALQEKDAPILPEPPAVADDQLPAPEPQADPALPAATTDERDSIGQYANVLSRVFRDGLGRLTSREKRDSDAISSIFRPVLNTVLELAATHHGEVSEEVSERIFRESVKAIERRAGEWKPEQADELAGPEFLRMVRSIVVNVARESAANKALKQLESTHE